MSGLFGSHSGCPAAERGSLALLQYDAGRRRALVVDQFPADRFSSASALVQ